MKKLIFLLVITTISIDITSAQTILINGVAFTKNEDNASPVPYSSIYFYDYDDNEGHIECVAFTPVNGFYDVGNIPVKNYRIEIYAPGYKPKIKNIGNLPKDSKGNFTLHFELEPDPSTPLTSKILFPLPVLAHEAKDVFAILGQIGGFEFDSEHNLTTNNDGVVKITFDDFWVSQEELVFINEQLLVSDISEIVYFDLTKLKHSLFDGVLNIIPKQGNALSSKMPFANPLETKYYDIDRK